MQFPLVGQGRDNKIISRVVLQVTGVVVIFRLRRSIARLASANDLIWNCFVFLCCCLRVLNTIAYGVYLLIRSIRGR